MEEIRTNFPKLEELLELEKIARKYGSGIEFDSLIGLWKFNCVWKKGSDKEDSISSTLLKVLSASLELRNYEADNEKFSIKNTIRIGIITLRFNGLAYLDRKQPLLPFFFDNIELIIGSIIIIKRSLPIPEEKKRPFFALISLDKNGKWLAARGKGGGLALWEKA